MPGKLGRHAAMASLGLLLWLATGVADAGQASPRYPPAGCTILQQDGVVAGAAKPQPFRVALGRCGAAWAAWLLGGESGRTVVLDALPRAALKENESVNLAGGACAAGKKPILENIILLAEWRDHASIKAGTGLVRAWLPDTRRKHFVAMPIANMVCYRDQP